MINWLHSRFHRPEKGWDPIPPAYAEDYARDVASVDAAMVEQFTRFCGGLEGKRVADVASGPGQYALEFARRGARVMCIDVSRVYLGIAEARLRNAGFHSEYACIYVDDIERVSGPGFDAIFSNVAWYYCMNDRSFARALWRSLRKGGVIGIRALNASGEQPARLRRKIVYLANRYLRWKIGHPHPPHGRIEAEFRRLGPCEMSADYSDPRYDVVFVRRLA